jgi:hypothetical protein
LGDEYALHRTSQFACKRRFEQGEDYVVVGPNPVGWDLSYVGGVAFMLDGLLGLVHKDAPYLCCVGWVLLYGTATLQARVLARWCGVGLIVGLPVTIFLGEIWGFVVFGILWLALGIRALVEK